MATWHDVLAWAEVADVEPERWELKALVRLAAARANVLAEVRKVKSDGDTSQARPNR